MPEYLHPGVYPESVVPVGRPIESVSTTTGALVGNVLRGKVGIPTFITSWANYCEEFARGLDSPFHHDCDLPYAVYGFFQNGGRRCYILRVGKNAKKAQAGEMIDSDELIFAKDEGVWGNNLIVKISKNEDDDTLFDVIVSLGDVIVERHRGHSNDTTSRQYFEIINKTSKYIEFSGASELVEGEYEFNDGSDGDALNDIDYLNALNTFDSFDDVNFIAIPGQTSMPVLKGILDWAAKAEKTFPILEAPLYANTLEMREIRKSLTGTRGAIYGPWVTVLDPLSPTGDARPTPPSGHIMGVFARLITERGVHKAPAGVTANLRGIVDVVEVFGESDSDILNPVGVNLIMPRTNYGICIWGARTLNPDTTMRYVSDELLNTMIRESLRNGTQWAVFEPNDKKLWKQMDVTCREYLYRLWKVDGALFGSQDYEAYYVQCNDENNTQETRDAGMLICDIAYAPIKPAEFVILRIAHSMRPL